MKKLFGILLLCASCGGKLTDEQRQRLHEGMATQDIKRVSDADLQQAAMTYAKSVLTEIEGVDMNLKLSTETDSLAQLRNVRIYSISPENTLVPIERKLVEAYASATGIDHAGDNLQKTEGDSLLFTHPVFIEHTGGASTFSHAIAIKMSKKTVVLSMPKP